MRKPGLEPGAQGFQQGEAGPLLAVATARAGPGFQISAPGLTRLRAFEVGWDITKL